MREELDLTKSRRPVRVPDDGDIDTAHQKVAMIGQRIEDLKDIQLGLLSDKKYTQAVQLSQKRVLQMVHTLLETPLNKDNLVEHAEIRGRISERLFIVNELQGVAERQTFLERMKENAKATIDKWNDRAKGKGRKNGSADS